MVATKKNPKPRLKPVWREHHNYGDVVAIAAELDRIRRKIGVKDHLLISPRKLAEIVRDGGYPALYAAIFEDRSDAEAAWEYRVNRARRICQGLGYEIVDGGEKKVFPGNISVRGDDGNRGYSPTPYVVSVADLKAQMIASCNAAINGLNARLRELQAADRRPEMEQFMADWERMIDRFKDLTDKRDRPQPPA